jgi:hypothetical protein
MVSTTIDSVPQRMTKSDGIKVDVDCARRVTEDAIASFEPRGRWLPTSVESIAEQVICTRLMHPYGDRRDGSKSSSIETQEVGAKW